jgi:nitrogen-specific signal transduction histidine kinase
MGGGIELESKPGRTVFSLVLPAEELTREPESEREPVTV